MVLEAASMSDSYEATLDTPDPYDTNPQTSTDFTGIDRSQLPKPLPLIGPLFGYTDPYLSNLAMQRQHYHIEMIGRRLSQKEREAITFHTYKSGRTLSVGMPMAFGFGMYRAYSTRENYRFPFFGDLKQPEGWWDGSKIRIMGQSVMEGSNARTLMHCLRASAYGSWALFLGRVFLSSYAGTVVAVGELRDPRLKDLLQAVKEKLKTQEGEPEAMKVQSKDPTGQGNTSVSDLWKRHRKDIGGVDDASPSAGADGYGGDVERLGGTNKGIMSDAQMRVQETRQQASPKDSPTENRASTFRLDKVEKQPESFGDTFDDASPTAAGTGAGGQGGSAWDRIRRQAQTSSGEKQKGQSWRTIKREQQAGSTTGDSFAFSSDDEQRQLAKDEAQDEFDARVERERQGGNFNENRGRRW
ncbi:MAG: hypothetical protein Q9166_003985 [cf. Caloplaca sp. 2 TL-2023]